MNASVAIAFDMPSAAPTAIPANRKIVRKIRSVHSSRVQPTHGESGMSSYAEYKPFGADEHRKRLGGALRRRLYPNTGLHPKMIAHALGVSTDTVLNWASGQTDPNSHKMGELMAFFSWSNDFTFWAEVYGPIGIEMRKRFAEKQRQREQEREAERRHLEMLTGTGE